MAKTTDFTNFANEHPNYFPGQYLLEDDFEIQHQYFSDRQRYHNQKLHISGIVEGLEVEVITGKKSVLIKSGSVIDGNGELIIVKKDITFSDFKTVTSGELYIQFSQEKQVKQQEDVADSYTRWIENPILGFAATSPANSVKLAKLTISGDTITLDTSVREYSGLSLPNSNSKALTFRSGGNVNPNLAVLTGSLKIDGDLTVNGTGNSSFAGNLTVSGTISGKIDAGNMTTGQLVVERIPNLPASKITSGELAVERIPNLPASKITSGELVVERISNLPASKITSGILSIDRIPNLSANKITSGTISGDLTVNGNQNISGNLTLTGVMSGAANGYQKAQFTMSGGGTVTWGGSGGRLKWTQRFIAISMERSTSFPAGFIDINQPTTNIPATQVYDGKARDTTVDGVVLNGWEALYAVHTVGGDNTNVSFQIVFHNNNFNAPSNWLLVAVVNGDNNTVKLGTGAIISAGGGSCTGNLNLASFKVAGDASTYYPVVFQDNAWNNGTMILEISRPNTHTDSAWRGSLISTFTCHSTNYGHGSEFTSAEIHQNRSYFIASYANATYSANFIVWLQGGTTYYWRSNHPVAVTNFDTTRKVLYNNEAFDLKTTVDTDLQKNHVSKKSW